MPQQESDVSAWAPPPPTPALGIEMGANPVFGVQRGSAGDEAIAFGDENIWDPAQAGPQDWHTLLLRLAGALPDDLISQARFWLAEGGQVDVAHAVGFAAATARIPVLSRDADLMAAQLRASGDDAEVVETLDRIDESVILPVPWAFTVVDPRREDLGDHVGPVDLTGSVAPDPEIESTDEAIRWAAAQEPGLVAIWRAWRTPADGSPWPAPRKIFVVQTGAETEGQELVDITVRLQDALVAAGEVNPQVEVCAPGTPVPGYQSSACAQGSLIWADEPAAPVRMARVFDLVDPQDGPVFAGDHPLIDDLGELTRLLQYLGNGLPVLTTAATMADILDPERPEVVPLTFRTDGQWVWTDTISYYLEHYGLSPEPELLAYLREVPGNGPEVSDVALHRVLSFLQRPDEDEPVWSVPQVSS